MISRTKFRIYCLKIPYKVSLCSSKNQKSEFYVIWMQNWTNFLSILYQKFPILIQKKIREHTRLRRFICRDSLGPFDWCTKSVYCWTSYKPLKFGKNRKYDKTTWIWNLASLAHGAAALANTANLKTFLYLGHISKS